MKRYGAIYRTNIKIKKCKKYQEFAKKSKSENSHACDHWNMRKYRNKILSTGK